MSSMNFKDVCVNFKLRAGKKKSKDGALNFLALNRVSFILNDGDRLGLIGKNGAGKSTLLRVISGILPATSGDIDIEGVVQGTLSLNHKLMLRATALENIRMQSYYLGMSGQDAEAYVNKVVELVDLGEFINQPVSVLSNGMRSRLLISLFHGAHHDIVAFDEWVGVLDRTQLQGIKGLRKIIDESKISVIASHNTRFIREYCNRVFVMDKGQIVFDGDVASAISFNKKNN